MEYDAHSTYYSQLQECERTEAKLKQSWKHKPALLLQENILAG
jgi:hypothetical protein